MGFILLALVVIPMLGAAGIALLRFRNVERVGQWSLAISTLAFLFSVWMAIGFVAEGMDGAFKFEFQAGFLEGLGSSFHLGVDGISLWLVLLTNLLGAVSIWASFSGIRKHRQGYYSLMLLLQGG